MNLPLDEIIIQARKQLQEGNISEEQFQEVLQQLGELRKIQSQQEMIRRLSEDQQKIQAQLEAIQRLSEEQQKIQEQQEANQRLSEEQQKAQVPSPIKPAVDEDIRNMSPRKTEFPPDSDLRQTSPIHTPDVQILPPDVDNMGKPQANQPNRLQESREKVSPEKLNVEGHKKEGVVKEGSPHKQIHKSVPEFERQGPLHNLYPDLPRGLPDSRGPLLPPPQNELPPGHPAYRGPHPGQFRGPDDRGLLRDPNLPIPNELVHGENRDGPTTGEGNHPEVGMGRLPVVGRNESIEEYTDERPDFMGLRQDTEIPPGHFIDEKRMRDGPVDGTRPRRDLEPFTGPRDREDMDHPDMVPFGPPRRNVGPPLDHLMGHPDSIESTTERRASPDIRDYGYREGHDYGPVDRIDVRYPERRSHDIGPPERRGHGPPDRIEMGPPERRNFGPPDTRRMGPPDGRDLGPCDRIRMGPADRRDGHSDRWDMGLSDRRDHDPPDSWGPPDRRDIGPPNRRDNRSVDRTEMGFPDRNDVIHAERRDRETPYRRDHGPPDGRDFGPLGERDLGHPNRTDMGPPDRRDFGPTDRRDMGHHDRGDFGPPHRRDVGHPDRRDLGPPDRKDVGRPDRRDFGPPGRRDKGSHDLRDHGPPDRRGMRPSDRRDPGHTDWKGFGPPDVDKVPPEFRDHGLPDRRSDRRIHVPSDRGDEEFSDKKVHGSIDRKETGPHGRRRGNVHPESESQERRDHGHPDKRLHGPPGMRDHGPQNREDTGFTDGQGPAGPLHEGTPLVDEVRGPRRPEENVAPDLDFAPNQEGRPEPSNSERSPQHDARTKQGRQSPHESVDQSLDGVSHSRDLKNVTKHNVTEPKKVTKGPSIKKHIPALLDMDVKPPPELAKKKERKEELDVDPNTGLPPWQPVEKKQGRRKKKERERPHSPPDNKPPSKNKRDHPPAEPRDEHHPPKHNEPRHVEELDHDWRAAPLDGKIHPNRRDGPLLAGPNIGPSEEMRPPNRRDGQPIMGLDNGPPEGMRHPNRIDGPPMINPDINPPEGMRHPNRRDGPLLRTPDIGPPEEIRDRERWDGPPLMRPDGPRPPFASGPHGPPVPHDHMVKGPVEPPPSGMGGPDMNRPGVGEDQRWTSFANMGPEISEEVVIGTRNYAIKLGDCPRSIRFFKDMIEVYADPSKRGIVVDGNLLYKFGERVKDVDIRGRAVKIFYHGKPVNLWIDGQNYEVRVDAPPRNIEINGKSHKIQIDGRDMMILIDKSEKGIYGGPPRFIYIDEDRMELRFDPPPRHILIDGKLCELMLGMKRPCVNIEGKLHGIRFDGPPRDIVIDDQVFQIHTDRAVKVKAANRFYFIALGGPCHELIIDGKWYELKFDEPPKEINVGSRILRVHIPGKPPEVKILPEIERVMPGAPPMPMGNIIIGPGPLRPPRPGMEPMMRPPLGPPEGPPLRPMGPNERLPFPMGPRPDMMPLRPEMAPPGNGVFGVPGGLMPGPQQMIPPFEMPTSQAPMRPIQPRPPVSMGKLIFIYFKRAGYSWQILCHF